MTVLTKQVPVTCATRLPRTATRLSDAELLRDLHSGDSHAFGELWKRHVSSVRRAVTHFTGFDADDVTAEAFARTLSALRRGYGPRDGFRSYVVAAARNIATEWSRRLRDVPVDLSVFEIVDESVVDLASTPVVNADLALLAFTQLPQRWQQILWHTEIEGRKPADVAPLLGLTANSAAALALRAREGLRQEWALAHVHPSTLSAAHEWYLERATKYAREKSGPRDRKRIEQHLSGCNACNSVDMTLQAALAELLAQGTAGTPRAERPIETVGRKNVSDSGRNSDRPDMVDRTEHCAAA